VEIGTGPHGTVWKGYILEGAKRAIVAIKEIEVHHNVNINDPDIIKLTQLRHKHIVSYIGIEKQDNIVRLFAEHLSGVSMAVLLASYGPLKKEGM